MIVNYEASKSVRRSKLPPIPEARLWLDEYNGGLSYNLSQGVPIDPPPLLLQQELAKQSVITTNYQYGAISGQPAFKEAFKADLSRHYNASLSTDNMLITPGANAAFYTTILALTQIDATSNIVLQSPFYFNHEMTLSQLSIDIRLLDCRADKAFVPNPKDLDNIIDANTRAVVLVTPNNPTGVSIPSDVLEECMKICADKHIPLILDETYRSFSEFDRPHNLHRLGLNNLIQLFSFSKDLAIPGLRLGGIIAHEDFIGQCMKVADCYQISPSNISQAAIAPVYDQLDDFKLEQKLSLIEKHKVLESLIDELGGWKITSSGAYYAFVNYPYNLSSTDVASTLARKFGILTLPGAFFTTDDRSDANNHLRISVANVTKETLLDTKQRWLDFDKYMKEDN